ncbi:MAG: hypothetical protein ACRDH5_14890, partial [bacterium]
MLLTVIVTVMLCPTLTESGAAPREALSAGGPGGGGGGGPPDARGDTTTPFGKLPTAIVWMTAGGFNWVS